MILNKSYDTVMNLSINDCYCIASFVRPFVENLKGLQLRNIAQYTFLNGYHYAEKGSEGLTNEFLKMYNEKVTIINGKDANRHTNQLQLFLERKSIASDLFIKGMALYGNKS